MPSKRQAGRLRDMVIDFCIDDLTPFVRESNGVIRRGVKRSRGSFYLLIPEGRELPDVGDLIRLGDFIPGLIGYGIVYDRLKKMVPVSESRGKVLWVLAWESHWKVWISEAIFDDSAELIKSRKLGFKMPGEHFDPETSEFKDA